MKFLVLVLCVCAASAAKYPEVRPVNPPANPAVYKGEDAEAPILRSESKVEPDQFSYAYETGNGISAQASGSLKKVGDADVLAIQGSYHYQAPDGTPVEFTYVADENGYQPKSDLLPVAPEMPEEIRRAVEYILAHPPKEDDKKY